MGHEKWKSGEGSDNRKSMRRASIKSVKIIAIVAKVDEVINDS